MIVYVSCRIEYVGAAIRRPRRKICEFAEV